MTTTTEANTTTIREGIEPVYQALKAACLANLTREAEAVAEKLKAHGWDFNAAYPYPSSFGMGLDEYCHTKAIMNRASRMVKADPTAKPSYMPKAPRIVIMDPELPARNEKETASYARSFIDAYAAKLATKIAAVDEAFTVVNVDYTGTNDPFIYSRLTLTDAAGVTMTCKTSCTINVSK